jgi:site-specific DNA-methyltransferase (adenine-specific)
MSELNITNEDNMALMARYPDKYFDLAIVDPPYGINISKFTSMGKKGKNNLTKYKNSNWDNVIPTKEYFQELFRVSKNQIIWGGNYFIEYLKNTSCVLIWDKHYIPEGFTMADLEMAWTSFNSPSKKLRIPKNKVTNCVSNNKDKALEYIKIHPTQKPIDLYKFCLENYAKEGDKILDTHLGSGSIAIACHDYKYDLTACELDKEYFDKAIERINNHTNQQKLF